VRRTACDGGHSRCPVFQARSGPRTMAGRTGKTRTPRAAQHAAPAWSGAKGCGATRCHRTKSEMGGVPPVGARQVLGVPPGFFPVPRPSGPGRGRAAVSRRGRATEKLVAGYVGSRAGARGPGGICRYEPETSKGKRWRWWMVVGWPGPGARRRDITCSANGARASRRGTTTVAARSVILVFRDRLCVTCGHDILP